MNKIKYGSPPPPPQKKKKKKHYKKNPQTPKSSISKQKTPPTAPSPPASLPHPNEIQGSVTFGDERWRWGGGRQLLRLRNGVSAGREQRGPGWGLGRDAPPPLRGSPSPSQGRSYRAAACPHPPVPTAHTRPDGGDPGHRSPRRGGRRENRRASHPLSQTPRKLPHTLLPNCGFSPPRARTCGVFAALVAWVYVFLFPIGNPTFPA